MCLSEAFEDALLIILKLPRFTVFGADLDNLLLYHLVFLLADGGPFLSCKLV